MSAINGLYRVEVSDITGKFIFGKLQWAISPEEAAKLVRDRYDENGQNLIHVYAAERKVLYTLYPKD